MRISNLFFEDEDKIGLKPNIAFNLRFSYQIILFLATAFILFSKIAILLGYPESIQISVFNKRQTIFDTIFYTLVHLSYLYIVFSILIFTCPPEKLYWQRLVIPSILFFAYFAQFLPILILYIDGEPFLFRSISESIPIAFRKYILINGVLFSYILFITIYIYWFIRDIIEYQYTYLPRRRNEIKFWFFAEVISIIVLIIGFLQVSGVIIVLSYWFNKDNVILLSLIVWFLVNNLIKDWLRGTYNIIYKDYLQKNQISGTIYNSTICLKNWENVKTILDYGCANGKRLKETLNILGIKGNQTDKQIIGFDRDGQWQLEFEETFTSLRKFIHREDKISPSVINAIFLSHMLYEFKTTKKVKKFLKKCEPGTYVIIRGMSPNSFFNPISMAYSMRIFDPTRSYLWYPFNLEFLVKKAKLSRLDISKPIDIPDIIVKQQYTIDPKGIDSAQKLLGYLYRPVVGERAKEYFTALHKLYIDNIPNDDFIYLFIKEKKRNWLQKCLA